MFPWFYAYEIHSKNKFQTTKAMNKTSNHKHNLAIKMFIDSTTRLVCLVMIGSDKGTWQTARINFVRLSIFDFVHLAQGRLPSLSTGMWSPTLKTIWIVLNEVHKHLVSFFLSEQFDVSNPSTVLQS